MTPAVPKQLHVSIDLETLSTATEDCPILEIGVTIFSTGMRYSNTKRFAPKFIQGLIDIKTENWWGHPDRINTYQQIMSESTHTTLAECLEATLAFIKEELGLTDLSKVTVWANSPSFDIAILRWWCEALQIEWPFSHNKERDIRTMRNYMKSLGVEPMPFPLTLTPHRAADDSLHQAMEVCSWYAWKNIL